MHDAAGPQEALREIRFVENPGNTHTLRSTSSLWSTYYLVVVRVLVAVLGLVLILLLILLLVPDDLQVPPK